MNFIHFGLRMEIEKLYLEWCEEEGIANKPNSFVVFLMEKGWLNKEQIIEDLKEPKTGPQTVSLTSAHINGDIYHKVKDESQTGQPCDGCEYSEPYIEYKCTHPSCKYGDEPQTKYKKWETKPTVDIPTENTTCVGVAIALVEDDFFREPTAEERKAIADYIDSISVSTGVNVFDLMDEPQTERSE